MGRGPEKRKRRLKLRDHLTHFRYAIHRGGGKKLGSGGMGEGKEKKSSHFRGGVGEGGEIK